MSRDPVRALVAVKMIARRSGRVGPRLADDDVLDLLSTRYGLHDAVELLRGG